MDQKIPKEMQKYLSNFSAQQGEDEENKMKFDMSKYIREMDDELKERFMALKSI